MDAILEQFLTEARDNLEYLDKHLEELNGGDSETINALFRAAHTLKGGAGLVGLNIVKELTHAAEDLLDAYRNQKIEYSDEMVDILFDAFDEVVEIIDAVEELGGVDVDIDEETIEKLKSSIRAFLSSDTPKEETFSSDLNIVDDIYTDTFNPLQIQKLAKKLPIKTLEINQNFIENDNWYLIDIDLDTETLKLGNDPIYLCYLLETEELEVSVNVNCDIIKENNLEWASHLIVAVKSNEEKISDAFYNIIDELRFRPLSVEVLFDNNLDSIENDMFEEFKSELIEIIKNDNYSILDEKISAITQVLNPETKEGFVLLRLESILTNFDISSNEYKEVLNIALDKMGIEIPSQEAPKEVETKNETKIEISPAEKEIIKDILNAQLKVLALAKDEVVIPRTILIVKNILDEMGEEEELKEDKNYLVGVIKNLLSKISDEKVEENVESKESKSEKQKPKTTLQKPEKRAEKHVTPKTIKIDQIQIDELMDTVGELLVVKNALPYIAESMNAKNIDESKRELNSKYEEISRIIEQLQDRVMQMRLLPLEYIFGRYPKLVRDISKKLNKKIKYIEVGGETKLDKMVIEKLADPLVHIIRNSLDHGLETPEERKAAGKPEEGTLEIKATSQGDKVFITMKDDGRGIDLNKVINKALEKSLISPDEIDKMSREDKLKLIFLPGLSTKEEITELSGRGVGTDAVKRTIEELGGKIYMKSVEGHGTEIKLELPLSVALTNIFHVMMNNTNYAIPMDYIVETVSMNKNEIQIANHKPFIKIRGELIPLLLEDELLGYEEIQDENSIVIITFNDRKVGFVVDEFVGQLDVVQKPLTGVISSHPFMSGVSLLGNGDILFILDITKILKDENDK